MYGEDNFWGSGSDQNLLSGYQGQQAAPEHQAEQIFEKTIWFVILSYMATFLAKKAWHRPLSAVILVCSIIVTVLISNHEQHFFWPVWIPVITGFIALGRMTRR